MTSFGSGRLAGRVQAVARHDEQRQPLDPRRRAVDAGQRHVDDVARQLVLAAGGPHLGPLDRVAPFAERPGRGPHVGQRGSGVRLRQRHGAEEPAVQHRRHPQPALLVGAVGVDQVGGGDGQEGVTDGRGVGGLEVREGGLLDGPGQLHAAEVGVVMRRQEPGLGERRQRLADLRDQHHPAVLEARLVGVRLGGVRAEPVLGDPPGGVDHLVERGAVVLGEARVAGQAPGVEHPPEREAEVVRVDQRYRHGVRPAGSRRPPSPRCRSCSARRPRPAAAGRRRDRRVGRAGAAGCP